MTVLRTIYCNKYIYKYINIVINIIIIIMITIIIIINIITDLTLRRADVVVTKLLFVCSVTCVSLDKVAFA